MTPANTDLPLRRSEVGVFNENAQNITINDDEEERRQARRRTMLRESAANDGTTFEETEKLKKCLEIYNCNKLSKENAWSYSLIDTLSTLLDRHHKSLNNLKIAGSSLEASSKVYGLRVDMIHSDVLRISAGLNAKKFNEQQQRGDNDEENDVATGGEGGNDPISSAAGVDANGNPIAKGAAQKAKPKRARKAASTITKNKETLNARLDTVPMQDPVFGKLNSISGSINSVHRLLNNVLFTKACELQLSTNLQFWDASVLEPVDYTEVPPVEDIDMLPCDRLYKMPRMDTLQVRPVHTGYVISDQPDEIPDDSIVEPRRLSLSSSDEGVGGDDGNIFDNPKELSMAFDINAECEPMPILSEQMPMLDVDYNEYDEMTTEERTAINNCRGLRRAPVLIEDLRPVDSSSKLEYSYRPLDKISQFWAGPSHWKFKRIRSRPSALQMQSLASERNGTGRTTNQRGKRAQQMAAKKRSQQLKFGEYHDDLFVKLDDKFKMRKANFQKKWDQRKLKLPTDMQLDADMFYTYVYALGLKVRRYDEPTEYTQSMSNHDAGALSADEDFGFAEHFTDGDDIQGAVAGNNLLDASSCSQLGEGPGIGTQDNQYNEDGAIGNDNANAANNTVLEIAHDYEGAPTQVTKIIVPFAKRAKVIDMKNLKRCCAHLMHKQMKEHIEVEEIPQHPIPKIENYADGIASFRNIYEHLPEVLTRNMTEALSPAVAFYSVLHLANDCNLRLIPQDDLEDFKMRQVML